MSDTIQRYIERVEKLREERASHLSEQDLQEIAREVGLSEDDLAAVDGEIQNHYDRGNGFVDHSMWDDAVRELEDAAALAPTRVYVLYALANAYFGRFQSSRRTDDRARAEVLARQCLDLDANYQPAYALLSKLREVDPAQAVSPTGSRNNALVVVGAALGLLVMGGVAAMLAFTIDDAHVESSSPTHHLPETVTLVSGNAARLGDFAGGLPVEIEPTATSEGLVVHIRKSEHSVHGNGQGYYSLKATLFNASDREIHEVKGKMSFFDADGDLLETKDLRVHDTIGGEMRPGDSAPFDTTTKAPTDAARMVLSMPTVTSMPASKNYSMGKKLDLEWQATKSSHIKLDVYERRVSTSDSSIGNYWKTQLAFVNNGDSAIKTVKVEASFKNAAGEQIGSNAWLIAYSGSAPIMPGETWCEGGTRQVPEGYDHYTLRIVEIE